MKKLMVVGLLIERNLMIAPFDSMKAQIVVIVVWVVDGEQPIELCYKWDLIL